MNISTKPYFIRALYEWCLDNGYTPYLAVWVNEHTRVPKQFVKDEQIVLSISTTATKDLLIDNEWISFHARFGGVSHEIWIPVGHVLSIFAKETGEGMGFEIEKWQPENVADTLPDTPATNDETPKKKVLKLVK
ncbi:ClpXP protease specificity-enhancing factor [Wielerella bovis]|uniref:ClpXP protease specificity-enhancing factor n=1 Tax=Wielerella bovis TaxID=2917790 RepID=UPI002018FB67|nr:ClpXP protease specificity-enhancing factor [Wielerella bovis]MCG7657863.1 ClpXP protease specificity-enhancing factor [Wielerella bovis]MCG7660085.1 ClpXP protease specificity-enhancing factor [Wielerella bovis]ULJ64526.1 ClpXP protease specificity-enhancing factor [Wielerella bovis]ULJ66815.1 ClpXP protease specificity-enhancing factor [Wielerella bovis]ULJ69038.1 ClpXP protease specificity-enhancing factor [Wielerella bovis]